MDITWVLRCGNEENELSFTEVVIADDTVPVAAVVNVDALVVTWCLLVSEKSYCSVCEVGVVGIDSVADVVSKWETC